MQSRSVWTRCSGLWGWPRVLLLLFAVSMKLKLKEKVEAGASLARLGANLGLDPLQEQRHPESNTGFWRDNHGHSSDRVAEAAHQSH
jgi:hypothetical protein